MSHYTYVHVGYPKTGSTTLQQVLFKQHPEIACLNSLSERTYQEFRRMQATDSIFSFESVHLLDELEKYRRMTPERCVLLSDENILSTRTRDIGVTSRRLQELFGPCRILIVLRSQFSILRSFYSNHGRFGQQAYVSKLYDYTPPFTFDEWLAFMLKYYDYSFLPILRYAEVVDYFCVVFGVGNVKVMLFEDFIHHKEHYITALAEFLGVDARTSVELLSQKHFRPGFTQRRTSFMDIWLQYPTLARMFTRMLDTVRLSVAFEAYLDRGRKQTVTFSEETTATIRQLYRDTNQQLIEKCGLDIERYEYPL